MRSAVMPLTFINKSKLSKINKQQKVKMNVAVRGVQRRRTQPMPKEYPARPW